MSDDQIPHRIPFESDVATTCLVLDPMEASESLAVRRRPSPRSAAPSGFWHVIKSDNWASLERRAVAGERRAIAQLVGAPTADPFDDEDWQRWLMIVERTALVEEADRSRVVDAAIGYAQGALPPDREGDQPGLWAALRVFGSLCTMDRIWELYRFLGSPSSRRTRLLVLQLVRDAYSLHGPPREPEDTGVDCLRHAIQGCVHGPMEALVKDPLGGAIAVHRAVAMTCVGHPDHAGAIDEVLQLRVHPLSRRLMEILADVCRRWDRLTHPTPKALHVREALRSRLAGLDSSSHR